LSDLREGEGFATPYKFESGGYMKKLLAVFLVSLVFSSFASAAPVTWTVSAVPIPAAVWLFGSALAGLGWLRRKSKPM
jgi:hypothetical protein